MSRIDLHDAAAYTYDLPPDRIAQSHADPRDASRLLVVHHNALEHATFAQFAQFLRGGDLLVLNETRVIAARLHGTRHGSGGAMEVLLLHPAGGRYDANATLWNALVKPARRAHVGQRIDFNDAGHAVVTGLMDDGGRELAFTLNVPFEEFLRQAGSLPLPPYIYNESAQAQQSYQTVFAKTPGSVAAPTASLHFTEAVFAQLKASGVEIARLTLDVGLGTFRPMKSARLDEHTMHAEWFDIPVQTADAVERAKSQGRRVVAAGTTVMRALEGSAAAHGRVRAGEDATDIFIRPGFNFAVVDLLLTNFHLPNSTLLVLVCAFAGYERVMDAYRTAVGDGYRFFSFGDAMLLERAAK